MKFLPYKINPIVVATSWHKNKIAVLLFLLLNFSVEQQKRMLDFVLLRCNRPNFIKYLTNWNIFFYTKKIICAILHGKCLTIRELIKTIIISFEIDQLILNQASVNWRHTNQNYVTNCAPFRSSEIEVIQTKIVPIRFL